jgi:hypothetical protein
MTPTRIKPFDLRERRAQRRQKRRQIALEYGIGVIWGLGLGAMAIDYGLHAPRPQTDPLPYPTRVSSRPPGP